MELDRSEEIDELKALFKSLRIANTKAGLWAQELVHGCNIDSVALLEHEVLSGDLESVFGSMQCQLKASAVELDFIRRHFGSGAALSPSFFPSPCPPCPLASSEFVCNGRFISNVTPLDSKSASSKSSILKGEYSNSEDKLMACVIKLAKSSDDFETELKILKELKLAQQTGRQTGCIAMYSSNTTTLPYYLVLEYGGSSISTLLTPSTSPHIIKDVTTKLLTAVKYLHQLNIVHLDIKPENIVCNGDIHNLEVKLIDLDSARHIGEPYPVIDGQLKYTANYACPEVALATDTSVRSNELMDYFSLGLVLWQLLYKQTEPLLASCGLPHASSGHSSLLTDQAALDWQFLESTPGVDEFRRLCSLTPNGRLGSLERLISKTVELSSTNLYARNRSMDSEVLSYLSLIDDRTRVLQDMSKSMMQQVMETESVLRRAIFEGTEVKVPTCFVILNQKISPAGAAATPVPSTLLDEREEKAKRWTQMLISIFSIGKGMLTGSELDNAAVDSFRSNIRQESVLYFYLIDEATGEPVVTSSDDIYPIKINVSKNGDFALNILPVLKLCYTAVNAINNIAGLARCLGYPINVNGYSVPELPSQLLSQFQAVVNKLDQKSSIEEFEALQSVFKQSVSGQVVVRGHVLRELEQFYLENDPKGQFAGLRRVCSSSGVAAERGAVCWTLQPSILQRNIQVSNSSSVVTGVTQDAVEAVRWYRLATDQGNAIAQYNLGTCYDTGKGVAKDTTEAVRWFRLAADQGNAAAQCNLGVCYKNGTGVTQDAAEAVRWYILAAKQGYAGAQFGLGNCYNNGTGVTKDATEAVRWYRLAADQGYAAAQFNLGVCYNKGRGVTRDDAEAVRWYILAADQGNADAQCSLGFRYDTGKGVSKDATEAVRWYKQAADQGNAAAQFNLGNCYKNGTGVTQDAAEAVRWYRLAADQGNADAQFGLGVCCDTGKGVTQGATEAVRWYTLAADNGNAAAQFNLGVCYKE